MLKPSIVEVAGPAPVILIPTKIVLATDKPPLNTTPAVPKAEASVVLVKVAKPEPAIVVPLKDDAVIVLLLNASVPAHVASVPVVGNVTAVIAVAVNV